MHPQFDMPSHGRITGRSSSITAAFFQALTLKDEPTDAEVDEALKILGMNRISCVCAYCGDPKTEWDHFRPIVVGKQPTGYITEIANLVPACGKCNQSKGAQKWKDWMLGTAKRSPATRRISDLNERVSRLEQFELWRTPKKLDYPSIVGVDLWASYMKHWQSVLDSLKAADREATELREKIESHLRVV